LPTLSRSINFRTVELTRRPPRFMIASYNFPGGWSVAMLDMPEVGRRCGEAKAKLVQLLGNDDILIHKLAQMVVMADLLTHECAWWQQSTMKKMRRVASELAAVLDGLDWLEFEELEVEFNASSREIFKGWTLPSDAPTNPGVARRMEENGQNPNDRHRGFLVRFHAQVRQLAVAGARSRGRPVDEVQRRVAIEVAKALLRSGRAASRSDGGLFANILRIILECANLSPPANMYRLTTRAMNDVDALIARDGTFAEEVRQAARQAKSTTSSSKTRLRGSSSGSGRSRQPRPRSGR
jgi:hypothetical protein